AHKVEHAVAGPLLFVNQDFLGGGCGHKGPPFSQQAVFAEFLGGKVGGQNKNQADDRLEQAERGRFAEVVGLEPAVHKHRNGGGEFGHGGVGQGQNAFKAAAHQLAELHNQHRDDGGTDAGQRDMQALLEAVGAIHFGGLIQFGVDVGDGGQVDDGAPAHGLPDADDDVGE